MMIEEFVERMKAHSPFQSIVGDELDDSHFQLQLNCPGFASSAILFGNRSRQWVISRTRAGKGLHEPGLVKSLIVLRELVGAGRSRVFYDVGLLYGYCSLMAGEILNSDFIFGFEMNPNSSVIARHNFKLNADKHSKMHVVSAGVGQRSRFDVPCCFKEFALRVDVTEAKAKDLVAQGFEMGKLNLIALDDFAALTGMAPNIIKIDVEGSQMSILKGAHRVLKQFRPILLIETDNVEAVNQEGVSTSDVARHLMSEHGYEIVTFDHRSWNFAATRIRLGAGSPDRNQLMVCFPSSEAL